MSTPPRGVLSRCSLMTREVGMTQDWPQDEGKWHDDRQKAQLSLSIRVNKRKVVEQRKKGRIFFILIENSTQA